jgi:hypothetical protein
MKTFGKKSLSSVIAILLNVASVIAALGLALAILLLMLFPFTNEPVEVDASWIVVGTTLTIPVAFSVDAQTLPVRAPSLGIDDAESASAGECHANPVDCGRRHRRRTRAVRSGVL